MFHLICQVLVYVREMNTCAIFIILKTIIFFTYVVKSITQLQLKQCWPVVTPHTASEANMIFEGSAALWHWPLFALLSANPSLSLNSGKGD